MSVCLFCREKKNPFRGIEHIIPESLGNRAYVLPRGVVCDRCNQYFSDLENYFCNYHLTAASKLLFLDETKKGRPPSLPLERGQMRREKSGKIRFQQPILEGKEKEQFSITFFKDEVIIEASWPLPDADSAKISRFLAKCGIETLYFKKKELAYEGDFDLVRRYARYGGRNNFVPFLWGRQNQRNIELYVCDMTSRKRGLFCFGVTFLPGSVYFLPLNRADEDYALKALADNYGLKLFDKRCLIKRESPKLRARAAPREKP